MDEQEKPFDAVSIVLLLTIAGFSDAADLATVLLFPVPVIGQVTYLGNSFLISPITWAIIQGWFIMKTSGGRISLGSLTNLIPVAGGLGNIANIPGSETITTVIAIWMANHPKATGLAVAAGAAIATGGAGAAVAATGETGAVAGAVTAETETGATVAGAKTAATGAEVGVATETGAGGAAAGKGVATEAKEAGELGEAGTENAKKEIPPEALGEEKSPFEKLQELTEKTPESPRGTRDQDEEQNVNIDDDANEVDLRKAA